MGRWNKHMVKLWGAGILALSITLGSVQVPVYAETVQSVTILESTHELVNGKMRVTADIRNGGKGAEAGFYVVGYDENGTALEVVGDSEYMMSDEIGTYEVDLDSGGSVKRVEVVPAGPAGDQAQLLASGYYTNNGVINVSGVVQNSTVGHNVGMLAVGYDASGKAVEVTSADSYLGGSNVGTFIVQLKAAKLIKSVKVSVIDPVEDAVKLLQTGSRLENGKLIVTGSIQNRNKGGQAGVIVVGSNGSGKVLEVNTTSGYLSSNEIATFQAELEAGKAVSDLKVFLTGNSQTPKIIAEGRTTINNKLVVTIGVENGDVSQRITVKSTAYDAKGRSLGTDTDSMFMTANETTTLRIDYDTRVKSVKLKYYDQSGKQIGEAPIRIKINGQLQSYAQSPVMAGGSVLVPMRPIFESLDASVKWDQKTQSVSSSKGSAQIKLKMGSKQAVVNGKNVALDSAPRMVKGTTMVPLRFVASALGCEVKWDGNEKMVLITTK
ncbi:stalk domain-containing protein [Paenibacillus sp. MDMC362]|uniref:stalk domain-containing protein n=1 Tax=Paenibacillus sp. MDMC362 TaxID=2977365 RepID=UPI000DC380CE|nr:stalk domain-containing protein [Paenibacillus sp. MDMC362]RAR46002.1 copper amine oxidase N-terminal domain-containing protein [Paenibacillus sp. MDMC362]